MIKLVSKLTLSSGAISGTIFLNVPIANIYDSRQSKADLEEINTSLENITTLEDMRLFEKINGCTFGFVNRWEDKEVYKLDGFLENNKTKSWENELIKGANLEDSKNKCKAKKLVALFNGPVKGFVPDKPPKGW